MASSPAEILPILRESWSIETSEQWLPENPARGQCNVTSLVVQDLFGGEILKTETPGGWHFYNRVDGKRYDLTASQFATPTSYADIASARTEALAGTRVERYAILKARVEELQARHERRRAFHMRKTGTTKALYAGSFDPITRGHLDIIGKALMTFDAVHVAIGTNVKKQRAFSVEESLRLIERSIVEHWPEAAANPSELRSGELLVDGALEIGEYTNQSLIAYARKIGATHIVRGLREASDFNEEFKLHGVAGRIDPSIPMVHFICEAQFLHVSSSTAKELDAMGEGIGWLVMPSVEAAFAGRRRGEPKPAPRGLSK